MSIQNRSTTDLATYTIPCDITYGIMGGTQVSSYINTTYAGVTTTSVSPSGGTGTVIVGSGINNGLNFTVTGNTISNKNTTFETVFKLTELPSSGEFIYPVFTSASGGGQAGIRINSSGTVQGLFQSANSTHTFSHSATLAVGNWYHVIASWGVYDEKISVTVNGTTQRSASSFGYNGKTIGQYFSAGVNGSTATAGSMWIDYVAVYNSDNGSNIITDAKIADRWTDVSAEFAALSVLTTA